MLRIVACEGGKKARFTEQSTKETVKTVRAGKAGDFRLTCGDYACVLFIFAREAMGASGTRLSLRPLFVRAFGFKNLGASRGEKAELCIAASVSQNPC
jgi:hypothetical protein